MIRNYSYLTALTIGTCIRVSPLGYASTDVGEHTNVLRLLLGRNTHLHPYKSTQGRPHGREPHVKDVYQFQASLSFFGYQRKRDGIERFHDVLDDFPAHSLSSQRFGKTIHYRHSPREKHLRLSVYGSLRRAKLSSAFARCLIAFVFHILSIVGVRQNSPRMLYFLIFNATTGLTVLELYLTPLPKLLEPK